MNKKNYKKRIQFDDQKDSEIIMDSLNYQQRLGEEHFNFVLKIQNFKKREKQIIIKYNCDSSATPLNKLNIQEDFKKIDIFNKIFMIANFIQNTSTPHGNLKPSNIIEHKDQLYLIDFRNPFIDKQNYLKQLSKQQKINFYPYLTTDMLQLLKLSSNEEKKQKLENMRLKQTVSEQIKQDIYALGLIMLQLFSKNQFKTNNDKFANIDYQLEIKSQNIEKVLRETYIPIYLQDLIKETIKRMLQDQEIPLLKIYQINYSRLREVYHLSMPVFDKTLQQQLQDNKTIRRLPPSSYSRLDSSPINRSDTYLIKQDSCEFLQDSLTQDCNNKNDESDFFDFKYRSPKKQIKEEQIDQFEKKNNYNKSQQGQQQSKLKCQNVIQNEVKQIEQFDQFQSKIESDELQQSIQENLNKLEQPKQIKQFQYKIDFQQHQKEQKSEQKSLEEKSNIKEGKQIEEKQIYQNIQNEQQQPQIEGISESISNENQHLYYLGLQSLEEFKEEQKILRAFARRQYFTDYLNKKNRFGFFKIADNTITRGFSETNKKEGEIITFSQKDSLIYHYKIYLNQKSRITYHLVNSCCNSCKIIKIQEYEGAVVYKGPNTYLPQGEGTMNKYQENVCYKGNWKNGVEEDENGKWYRLKLENLKYGDIYKYKGSFKNGKFNGFGIAYLNKERTILRKGKYKNGNPVYCHKIYEKYTNKVVAMNMFFCLSNIHIPFK
ncbi:unnamed protein product [Paramecium sonneborni]|uniref:Protein kinase domain-containing protein n=1 Tax=Paramecium sonneborni TaxID=65129 RepID=A0A8S1RCQ3_9CILI|nr:unnamed protein product [Paramecium sonneborni]